MNPNKRKGDRAERAARDYLNPRHPTIRTRAGFNADLGDLIATTPAGRLVIQVKDTAAAKWTDWFTQLDNQTAECRKNSTGHPVIGGILLWKTRGSANPATWRVISRLDRFLDLLDAAHHDATRLRAELTAWRDELTALIDHYADHNLNGAVPTQARDTRTRLDRILGGHS